MKKILILLLYIFIGCSGAPKIDEIAEVGAEPEIVTETLIVTETVTVTEYVEVTPAAPPPIPDIPLNLNASSLNGQISLTWDDALNATSYNVYYSPAKGVHNIVLQNVTSPYIQAVQNGTTNYYVVTAVNVSGESFESTEASATAGIIDNMNGTITVMSNGLTWSKCDQVNSAGISAYNSSMNDCSAGIPAQLQWCSTNGFECANGYRLIGGQSEVYNTCMMMPLAGGGWRVPTAVELHSLHDTYINNQSFWPGLMMDYHWSTDSWQQAPYYAAVLVDPYSNATTTPAIHSQLLRYVICVR